MSALKLPEIPLFSKKKWKKSATHLETTEFTIAIMTKILEKGTRKCLPVLQVVSV